MLVVLLTILTMVAFAANSVLCRIALGGGWIDPLSFTLVRLAGGAAILVPLSRLASGPSRRLVRGSWGSAAALFGYAAAFSLAYLTLEAGTGALVLFGAVQVTMIGAGLRSGDRPHSAQWLGLLVALAGLIYLVLPGIAAPNPLGMFLMALSGISWGVYSLRGKQAAGTLAETAGNFLRAVPLSILALVVALTAIHTSGMGLLLALVSGSVTSGLGYALWYRTLRHLSTPTAAVVQLLVPVLAALGGVVFLSEAVSFRLVAASILVLGGVGLALRGRSQG